MNGEIRGDFKKCKTGHDKHYFVSRGTYLDCRGGIVFPASANLGVGVKFITYSHDISIGEFGKTVERPIVVGEKAWIASFAILYNCTIGDGAVVACGAVVRNMHVPSYTMVAGNPARIVGHFDQELKEWIKWESHV